MIVKHVTYETTDPTVDSQIIQLKDSGANVFFNIAIPKFAAQAMRKAGDLNWKPVQYLNNVSSSVASTMKPAGFDNVQGVVTAQYLMDPTDKQWDNNADMKAWVAWMGKYKPGASLQDASNVFAYSVSVLMHETLKKCGDDLTRENLMKQAANFQKFRLPMLLPGITVSTSPTDLLSDPGSPALPLQGRDLGAVRRHHGRRKQLRFYSSPVIRRCPHRGESRSRSVSLFRSCLGMIVSWLSPSRPPPYDGEEKEGPGISVLPAGAAVPGGTRRCRCDRPC